MMFTKDELEALQSLVLFSLLVEALDAVVIKWRSFPHGYLPTDQEEREIYHMESYAMTIVRILVERNELPQNWERQ